MPNKSLIKHGLYFTDEVQQAISDLTTQYGLERDLSLDIFKLMKIKDPDLILFNFAKRIMEKRGRFVEIANALQKEFGMNFPQALKLAHDIKDKIVFPFTEITTARNESKPTPNPIVVPPTPYAKKIEVGDVEENAKALQGERGKKPTANEIAEELEKLDKQQKTANDPYRETVGENNNSGE